MGRSRSPWLFSADRDVVAASRHPFDGLPLEWVGKIIADGSDVLGNAGMVGYFNTFTQWEGPVAEGAGGGWTLSGATGAATVVLADVANGAIVLTSDSTSGANPTLQLGSATTGANFLYTVGKQIWCFTRVKLLTVASMEFFFGLATPDTAPCTSDTFPSDGIFLTKASTDTTLTLHARKDGTSTSQTSASGTLVDATYATIGFRVMKNGTIIPYYNGTALVSKSVAAGAANLPTAAADILQFITGFKGASMTATYDWILVAQDV